jgi:hypothetical protein
MIFPKTDGFPIKLNVFFSKMPTIMMQLIVVYYAHWTMSFIMRVEQWMKFGDRNQKLIIFIKNRSVFFVENWAIFLVYLTFSSIFNHFQIKIFKSFKWHLESQIPESKKSNTEAKEPKREPMNLQHVLELGINVGSMTFAVNFCLAIWNSAEPKDSKIETVLVFKTDKSRSIYQRNWSKTVFCYSNQF